MFICDQRLDVALRHGGLLSWIKLRSVPARLDHRLTATKKLRSNGSRGFWLRSPSRSITAFIPVSALRVNTPSLFLGSYEAPGVDKNNLSLYSLFAISLSGHSPIQIRDQKSASRGLGIESLRRDDTGSFDDRSLNLSVFGCRDEGAELYSIGSVVS